MNRVFVSYSFKDSELYIVTLLFEKLRKEGFIVDSSEFNFNDITSPKNHKIINAVLFIGIITNESNSIAHVVSEWKVAQKNNIKTILIIENGIEINDNSIKYIRFDRKNPQAAINQLFKVTETKLPAKKTDDTKDALVAAGIVLGIAGLIALLATGSKK